jgi:O-methyltransferase
MLVKNNLTKQYLSLLKKSLVGDLYIENEFRIISAVASVLYNQQLTYSHLYHVDRSGPIFKLLEQQKDNGNFFFMDHHNADGSITPAFELRNFTELSHTMIGRKRMDNLQYCVETVLDENIPGDLIETGVWRGGATIFMRGILAAYGISDRAVWVADSFQGVPPPSLPQDANFDISARVYPFLAVSQEAVSRLFERYALLDAQVKFLAGWFKDTLTVAPIATLAVLRLDGDLYESTMDALNPLYPKVAPGGFIIVDDYYSCPPCKHAIDDFRTMHGISDGMIQIDDQSLFWRKH